MGIYTSYIDRCYSECNYDYTKVEPFCGEHFNFHELGIKLATESAINTNSFMKSIALGELASIEQYGTEEVFYEGINIGSIIEKIKMFFKKIIEKIHKIFHTFIARMSAWFGDNKTFVRNYEKEIIKGWSNVKNDWEYKGYNFEKINTIMTKTGSEGAVTTSVSAKSEFKNVASTLNVNSAAEFESALEKLTKSTKTKGKRQGMMWVLKSDHSVEMLGKTGKNKNEYYGSDGNTYDYDEFEKIPDPDQPPIKGGTKYQDIPTGDDLSKFREDFNENGKDKFRGIILENIKKYSLIQPKNIDLDEIRGNGSSNSLDQKEYTEELFKVFRNDEDSPVELNKGDIEKCYNGSITSMMLFIKDYDNIKRNLEKAEKNMINGIDNLIRALNNAENKVLKDKTDTSKSEGVVQFSTVFQSFWGFVKETQMQAFSALLQAVKDACVQAKGIAVKVIGQSKKMTEESYDYSSNNDYNFISSVKLI